MKKKTETNSQTFFILHSNCLLVRGHSRSTICDLQLGRYKLIPNELEEILQKCRDVSIDQLKREYNNEFDEGIDAYFKKLAEGDWGMYTDHPKLFPKIDTEFEYPGHVTNAIIDIGTESDYDVFSVISQLEKLGCMALQIRSYRELDISELRDLGEKTKESSIKIMELYVRYSDSLKSPFWDDMIQKYPRFRSVVVHSCAFEEQQIHEYHSIIFSKQKMIDCSGCGVVSKYFFSVNTDTFFESLGANSCLNKKISIDVNGNIKNCPSFEKAYGKIGEVSLQEALGSPGFKDVWKITKDEIEVCKDCEFRHICTDCRAYVNKGIRSKPAKCSYDPYSMEWLEYH